MGNFLSKYGIYPMLAFGICQMFSLPAGNVCMIAAAVVFLIYCYKYRPSIPTEYRGYAKVIVVFLLVMLASTLASEMPGKYVGFWANRWLWRSMGFWIIILMFNKEDMAKKLLLFALLGFLVDGIAVIYHGIAKIYYIGMDRPSGFFDHPMKYGGMACLWMPTLLILGLDKTILAPKQRLFVWVAFAISCVAVVVNATRGAWIAIIPAMVGIVVYYCRANTKQICTAILLLCICGSLSLCIPFVQKKISSISDTSNNSNIERFYLWQSATRMFIDNPVLGVGYGSFQEKYAKQYKIRRSMYDVNHAHNNAMEFLGETGILGLGSFLALWGYFILHSFQLVWKEKNPYALMLGMGTLCLFIQGLTEYNFGQAGVAKNLWYFWGILAVLVATYKTTSK